MFEFALPWVWVLVPLPWLARWFLPAAKKDSAALYLPQIRKIIPGQKSIKSFSVMPWLLPTLVWCLLLAACARPVWVGEPVSYADEAREVMIALDLSGSMEMDDMYLNGRRVTRLEAAHGILADFIRRRHGDRIGLIVYADHAYVYAPVSSDLNSIAKLAEEAQIGLAGRRTALGDAIALSIKYFTEREAEDQVVLMLTDGAINTGVINADQALQLARTHDIKIHTIGIGSDEHVVESIFGQRRVDPSTDMDETFLTQIAHATGGEYFRARNTEQMEEIYRIIDEIEPVQSDDKTFRPQKSLVHWPLAGALLLSLLMFLPWQPVISRINRSNRRESI